MSGFIEQAADGRILEWREHDFTELLMENPALVWLEHEPFEHAEGAFKGRTLDLQVDAKEFRWKWRSWDKVHMDWQGGHWDEKLREEDGIGPQYALPWSQVDSLWVDITPFREDHQGEQSGITRRLYRPVPRVEFVAGGSVSKKVRLSIVNGELFENIVVQLFSLENGNPVSKGNPLPWRSRRPLTIDLPAHFEGYIAVCAGEAPALRVLDASSFAGGILRIRLGKEYFPSMEQAVNGGPLASSFEEWPHESSDKLHQLAESLDFGFSPEERIEWAKKAPNALFRLAFLQEVTVLPPGVDSREALRRLGKKESLLEDLASLWPSLANVRRLANPRLQLLLLTKADHPRFDELFEAVRKEPTESQFRATLATFGEDL